MWLKILHDASSDQSDWNKDQRKLTWDAPGQFDSQHDWIITPDVTPISPFTF